MNRRLIVPLILLLIVIVAVTLIPAVTSSIQSSLPQVTPTATPVPFVTINCIIGSEKQPFFNDPEVIRALREDYQIAVTFTTAGSINMVTTLPTEELRSQQVDCLSPSNNSASTLFERYHSRTDFPGYQTADVFYSPLVVLAVAEARDAQMRAGVVQERNGYYYIIDVGRLGDQIINRTLWTDLDPSATLRGPIKVGSTDPAASNSGNLLYFLLGNAFAGDASQALQMSDLPTVLPLLSNVKDSQGLQANRSEDFFNRWISGVAEYQYPLGWVYESQILEYSNLSGVDFQSRLNSEFSILYPEPGVYSVHQFIALSPNGQRLIAALQTPALQQLAWDHGFRSLTAGVVNDQQVFPNLRVPTRLTAVTSLPDAPVIERIVACLKDDTQC